MGNNLPYFHLLSSADIEKLEEQKTTWGDVMKNFKQPDWCGYKDALNGRMGCWSLTDAFAKVNVDFCKTCSCFKKHYNYE